MHSNIHIYVINCQRSPLMLLMPLLNLNCPHQKPKPWRHHPCCSLAIQQAPDGENYHYRISWVRLERCNKLLLSISPLPVITKVIRTSLWCAGSTTHYQMNTLPLTMSALPYLYPSVAINQVEMQALSIDCSQNITLLFSGPKMCI